MENSYIKIYDWQVRLGLKSTELIIFACIYESSQKNQSFNKNLKYLTYWTNCSKQGVLKALKSLIDKGFIEKKEHYFNGVKSCEYFVITEKIEGDVEM